MDYALHYQLLIARARVRQLDGYHERHHVIPKCLGGGDAPENIVVLTAEEHYVAHQLLVKLNPGNSALSFAVVLMAGRCSNNKAYGWLRRKVMGRVVTPEMRAKISAATKDAMSRPDVFAKVSAARTGRALSPEWRAAVAAGMKGIIRTEAERSRLSATKLGRPGPRHSEVTKAKMSASHKGKVFSAEHRAAISAAQRGIKRRPTSPEARAKISAALLAHHRAARNVVLTTLQRVES